MTAEQMHKQENTEKKHSGRQLKEERNNWVVQVNNSVLTFVNNTHLGMNTAKTIFISQSTIIQTNKRS